MKPGLRTGWAAIPVFAVTLTSCSLSTARSDALDSLDALPEAAEPVATTTTAPPPESPSLRECKEDGLEAKSLRPRPDTDASEPPTDDFGAEIRSNGKLRVGVDENTLGFAARNPETGDIEGFEVDLAHEIAERIFGSSYQPDMVQLVPVVTSEKTDVVRDGDVDMTISAISMSCKRWEDVAFSTEYYTAFQEFLVRADSGIDSVGDLDGRTVCVTARSSSIGILEEHAPQVSVLPKAARTECLVALQNGEADAYFGHDSFLYGMKAQDRTLVVREDLIAKRHTVSHYGIAIAQEHEEFLRYVNAVLEDLRNNGKWQEFHEQRLEAPLEFPPRMPPPADYRD